MVQIWWSKLKRVPSYRADKQVIDTQTDRHTHTPTQATTIPEVQNRPRVNSSCFVTHMCVVDLGSHRFMKRIDVCTSQSQHQGVASLTFRELFKINSQKYTMPDITFALRIPSMDLGTRTKRQLEMRIWSTISAIHTCRENILESSRDVSETTPLPRHNIVAKTYCKKALNF